MKAVKPANLTLEVEVCIESDVEVENAQCLHLELKI